MSTTPAIALPLPAQATSHARSWRIYLLETKYEFLKLSRDERRQLLVFLTAEEDAVFRGVDDDE